MSRHNVYIFYVGRIAFQKFTFIPNRHALIRQLARDRSWRLVSKDEVAVVFVRADAAGALAPLTATYADATRKRLVERRAWAWQYPLERAIARRH